MARILFSFESVVKQAKQMTKAGGTYYFYVKIVDRMIATVL